MMRSLIDGNSIVTRRRRSRLRGRAPSASAATVATSVSLALALVGSLAAVLVTLGACQTSAREGQQPDGLLASDLARSLYQLDGQLAAPAAAYGAGHVSESDNENVIVVDGDKHDADADAADANDDDDDDDEDNRIAGAGFPRALAVAGLGRAAPLAKNSAEVYLLEDKDYPKSVFENYAQRLGQVSGIASFPSGGLALFHRADRHWDERTFNETSKRVPLNQQDNLIKDMTIMIIDADGNSRASLGSNLFYMPHSIASDRQGNLWVSDVARHQVMRLPASNMQQMGDNSGSGDNNNDNLKSNGTGSGQSGAAKQIWPDIILGEAFMPGQDDYHFCQPAEIAVSSNGELVYVADGYCNQRVMVFSGATGKVVGSFGQNEEIRVAHSLALIEERNLVCVADRENHRILCYNAGLNGQLMHLGELMHQIEYPIGRVFAIASISPDHLLVSSNQAGTSRYDLAILNPFTQELKLVWISSDLLEPHSLATTFDRQYAYAADMSKDAYKKVYKFHIILRKN